MDIKKLKENGIHSVEALAHSNKRDLVLMKGLSEAKVDKMQKECKYQAELPLPAKVAEYAVGYHALLCHAAFKLVHMGFTTASSVMEQRKDNVRIGTGCKDLNNILEGVLKQIKLKADLYQFCSMSTSAIPLLQVC